VLVNLSQDERSPMRTDGRRRRASRRPGAAVRRLGAVPWWRLAGRTVRLAIVVGLLGLVIAGASVAWVRAGTDRYTYTAQDVPEAPVALVLGAQVYATGEPSPFLQARLAIAQQLLETGKVRAILVSGDHREFRYDEPGAMERWLVGRGVPVNKIAQDHAGFDTYDSCTRAIKIFGVRKAIVVTQAFHLPRAIMLCRHAGIETYGVGDWSMKQFHKPWLTGATRENGACVKAVVDVVSRRDPVFLGRHETSVDDAVRAEPPSR
jgi:vancomycin permeability regulator SanA